MQNHLNHYLSVLFPEASLEVDEQLRPGTFSRGNELGQITELSFGAREQMGLISRLAYADLLREAGRPILVILDDTLVHSDNERLEDMKRILFDAAPASDTAVHLPSGEVAGSWGTAGEYSGIEGAGRLVPVAWLVWIAPKSLLAASCPPW